MTDLVVAPRQSASLTVPPNEWLVMSNQAEVLAQSDIIPAAYRRKPANIMVAALTGRTHGWDVLTAMRNGHVIEGVWGMKPEAMLGLIRQAGHSVGIGRRERGVVVVGKRCDTGDEMDVKFDFDDAVTANLITLKDGRPHARSSSGKRLPWELHPIDMCQWRAVAILGRALFSDVTLGLYTAEELGMSLAEDGEAVVDVGPIDHGPRDPAPLSLSVMEQFGRACDTEGLTTAEVLGAAYPDAVPDPLTDEHLPRMRDVFKDLVAQRAAARSMIEGEIVEAEVVDEGELRRDEIGGGTTGADDSVRPASRGQIGLIKAAYDRMGYDRAAQLETTTAVLALPSPLTTHTVLNTDQASRVLDYLNGLEE